MTTKPVKTYTTYGLKHAIEQWAGDYVHEQECVLALMESGFTLHHLHADTYLTNVDAKSVRRVKDQGRRQ
jgi:hypothetical protein